MQMTKAFGRVLLDAGADLLHHLEVDAEQVVAAHAGLARHAGGDDARRRRRRCRRSRWCRVSSASKPSTGAGLRRCRAPCPAACPRRCRTGRRRRVPSGRRDGPACRRSARRRSARSSCAPWIECFLGLAVWAWPFMSAHSRHACGVRARRNGKAFCPEVSALSSREKGLTSGSRQIALRQLHAIHAALTKFNNKYNGIMIIGPGASTVLKKPRKWVTIDKNVICTILDRQT